MRDVEDEKAAGDDGKDGELDGECAHVPPFDGVEERPVPVVKTKLGDNRRTDNGDESHRKQDELFLPARPCESADQASDLLGCVRRVE